MFSDLHCNHKQLSNLSDYLVGNKEIEALVFAGDAVNMGEPVSFMEQFIKVIDNIGKPFLWVPGNNDFGRAYHKLNAKYKSLEGRVAKLPSTCHPEHIRQSQCKLREGSPSFTGVGGSPASWAGQYQGEKMIDQQEIAGSIFVSHYPPPGQYHLEKYDQPRSSFPPAVISTHRGQSGAEKSPDKSLYAIRNTPYVNRQFSNAPKVHLCGHLHYKWGTGFIGQTKIIQLASLETGHYAILDLESLAVNFERF